MKIKENKSAFLVSLHSFLSLPGLPTLQKQKPIKLDSKFKKTPKKVKESFNFVKVHKSSVFLSKEQDMNFLGVSLLPIWALTSNSLVFLVDARPESTFSPISGSSILSNKEPFFLLSTKMEAQSPGMTEVPMAKVAHNQDINKRILIALIISSTLLGGILLFLSCFWINRMKNSKNCRAKNKQNLVQHEDHAANGQSLRSISSEIAGKKGSVAVIEYELLEAATNNFQEDYVLGEGGHGRVYKAHLNEKLIAAVKRLEGDGQDLERQFENELRLLAKIRHQNIIFLMGCCIHRRTRFLVYEMMQNGSLESQLHRPTHESKLTWHLRMKIAVDIARGLEYLHEHCNPPVVHRDLKSSNILLDSNFNAKLSDFGLATPAGIQNDAVKLSGTLGYVAPEYLLDGKLTDKSDVYAFGVILLELLTGRKPVERVSQECLSIVTWAMPQLTDRSKLPSIVDPVIRETMDLKHLYQVAAVAVLCVQQEPSYRPLITDVLHSLIPLVPLELGGSLRITEPAPPVRPTN